MGKRERHAEVEWFKTARFFSDKIRESARAETFK